MPSEKRLAAALAKELSESLLPGEEPFTKPGLAEAARIMLDAARERQSGKAVIAIEAVTGTVAERLTRIAVVNDDMPFLVDSIAATVAAQGLAIDRLAHPAVAVRRNAEGDLEALGRDSDDQGLRESIIYIETARADARTRVRLRSALAGTLEEVRAAVTDWRKLQAAMAGDADRLEGLGAREGAALLRWFRDGMLTQLGHALRRRDGRTAAKLGICRLDARALPSAATFERAFAWFDANLEQGLARAPLLLKADEISHVHRRGPADLLLVPVVEGGPEHEDMRVTAIAVHAGLWTSAALAAPPDQVPCLRASLAALMARFGFDPRGHDGKALVHALRALPHDLLLAFGGEDLARVATTTMSLVDRPRPRVLLVRTPLDRHLHAFVWLPRDTLSTALRREVQAMVAEAAGAAVLDWNLEVDDNLAMLRFVVDIDDAMPTPDEAALDERLIAMVRGWPAAVEAALARCDAPARAAALAARYAEAFPLAYRTAYGPAEAAQDILRLHGAESPHDAAERSHAPPARDARFHRPEGGAASGAAGGATGGATGERLGGSTSSFISGAARLNCRTRCRCSRTSASASPAICPLFSMRLMAPRANWA